MSSKSSKTAPNTDPHSAAAAHNHPLPDFAASEARLRRQLLLGTHQAIWEENLGTQEYQRLQSLAREAAALKRGRKRGTRVYILPGMMGSKLGGRENGSRANTLLWIDPEEIQRGRLMSLALPAGRRFKALGVMVLSYLKLKLTLEIAGFDVEFHAYDWRRGIDELGAELAGRLKRDRARSIMLVAHSMGGLVSRVAVNLLQKHAPKKITRVVLLGTPNFGSFAPVMALRGVYPAVRKVATLDPRRSAELLTQRVFNTFPGLHHMLPAAERFDGFDLYDPAQWPTDKLGPRHSLLKGVKRMRALLAQGDERFVVIAGVDHDTVTDMTHGNGAFDYVVSRNGDGTVPLDLALLPGAKAYYVKENHASLPANSRVCSAVLDLLRTGKTRHLPGKWTRIEGSRILNEGLFRQMDVHKHDWAAMSPHEQRLLLQGLVLPMPTQRAGD